MTTSGSTDFTMTARDIIQRAFRLAKIYAGGETIGAEDAEDATSVLNLMLKGWTAKEHLWIREELPVTLVAGQAAYSIPTARRVESVRRRIALRDTPLSNLGRREYEDLPNKAGLGTPVSWYFDPQRSTRTLYVWPTPSASLVATTTLRVTALRVIEDIDGLENEADVPQEWLETLVFNLAARLGAEYGTEDRHLAFLVATAAQMLKDLTAQDQEDASIFIQPDERYA